MAPRAVAIVTTHCFAFSLLADHELNNAFPIVANRKFDSTLRVSDGQTIVLGGLFSDVDSDAVTKLPFLGDLPVLGAVFRNRQRSHTRDEVVFYITPHIL